MRQIAMKDHFLAALLALLNIVAYGLVVLLAVGCGTAQTPLNGRGYESCKAEPGTLVVWCW